jgi:hypothetical protein
VPDYPGRYQVDPTTGQVVDTGNASMPGNPVVSVPVAPPPPPPAPVILPPPPLPPAEEPQSHRPRRSPSPRAAHLGRPPGAPVGWTVPGRGARTVRTGCERTRR